MPDITFDSGIIFPVSDPSMTPISIPGGKIEKAFLVSASPESDVISLQVQLDILASKLSKRKFTYDETEFKTKKGYFPFKDISKNLLNLDRIETTLEYIDKGSDAGKVKLTITAFVPDGKVGGAGL